jgi:hypothetical protein
LTYTLKVPPIDLHLDKMLLFHEGKQLDAPTKEIAKKARERIGGRINRRRRPNHHQTKLQKTTAWAERLVEETRGERPMEYSHFKVAAKAREKEQWAKRWEHYKTGSTRRTPAMEEVNGRPILNVRSKLTRRETTIATLVRSECIGFKAFLHRMKVPGFDNPNCDCGGGSQTAKHMIMYCPLLRREQLFVEAGSQDYKVLTSTVRGLRAVAKWTIRSGLLAQFKLYEHTG